MSKKWKDIIENLPEFKEHLHLRLAGHHTRNYDFSILMRSNTKFNQLSLTQIEFNQIPIEVWETIGPRLKILSFSYCLKMRLQDFNTILRFCSNIEHLQIFDHFPPFGPGYDLKSFQTFEWNVKNIKKCELFRASAIDNKKLENFFENMYQLEYLRIESQTYQKIEETIFNIVSEKSNTIRSLFLVDNKEDVDPKNTLVRLISLNNDTKDETSKNENAMEVQYEQGPKLITFGCRLNNCEMTWTLNRFLESYALVRVFEVWTDEAVLEPQFLFDMFANGKNLDKLVIHCDQNDKTFTRDEVQLYQRRKLKKIVFFPD